VLDPEIRRTLIEGEGVHDVTPRAAAAYMINTLVTEAGGTVLVSEPAEGIMIFGAVFNGS
jgi:histidine phosphotransferase ChpT